MKDTREHILFTSFRLILKKGYSNVSMNELVQASNLSKGAFYHYFKSKEELYLETINKYFFSYLETFELKYNDDLSFAENLSGITKLYLETMTSISELIGPDDVIISYYLTIFEGIKRSPEIKLIMSQYFEKFIDEFSVWMKIGQNNGDINKDLNPVLLSKHFSGLLEGTMIMNFLNKTPQQIKKEFEDIIAQFLTLIKNN